MRTSLLEPGVVRKWLDEDGRQEYALARLEGHDESAALQRAVSACRRNQLQNLGPRSHGQKLKTVTVAGFPDWWQAHKSCTLDDRSPAEVEAAFDRSDEVLPLLDHCTPVQRTVLEMRYGIGHPKRMTYRQICDVLGYVHESAARDRELDGLQRIRRTLLGDAGLTEAERERRDAKRERQRLWMARKRAAAKVAA